jgi:tetratricopeptide (TPR) repeat protein
MVEEIITALSRIRWLFVIARNSTFTYKGRAVDVKEVGRELGVRYVLEGSVRKAGGRVRITAQLIDALSGTHLWADRFDGSLEDVFDLQDKVALSVAGVIEPALQAAEMRRSAARPTTDLSAYDLYLRALAVFYPMTKERIVEALGLLEQAIAIDRHYGPALAWAANCHMRLVRDGWAEEPETSRRKAMDLARQALQVSENDPGILANAAFVLAQFGEETTCRSRLSSVQVRNFTFATSSGRTQWTRLNTRGEPKRVLRGGGRSSGIDLPRKSGHRVTRIAPLPVVPSFLSES